MKSVTLSELLAHKSFEGFLSSTAVRAVLLEAPVRVAIPGLAMQLVMLEALVRVFRPLLDLSALWTLLVLDDGVVLCFQG